MSHSVTHFLWALQNLIIFWKPCTFLHFYSTGIPKATTLIEICDFRRYIRHKNIFIVKQKLTFTIYRCPLSVFIKFRELDGCESIVDLKQAFETPVHVNSDVLTMNTPIAGDLCKLSLKHLVECLTTAFIGVTGNVFTEQYHFYWEIQQAKMISSRSTSTYIKLAILGPSKTNIK